MGFKLSILIPTLPRRKEMFDKLVEELGRQSNPEVQLISNNNETLSIGAKRNLLLEASTGEYVCFIDDDDMISSTYIDDIMTAIRTSPDCVSLRGVMTTYGENPEMFEHSLRYSAWITTTNPIKYERYPNHLNVIRASIAKQFKFPEINFGEDHKWAEQVHLSGLIKDEYYLDKVLYNYQFIPNKTI